MLYDITLRIVLATEKVKDTILRGLLVLRNDSVIRVK